MVLIAQHDSNSLDKKPTSLLVVPLGYALDGMTLFLCGRHLVGSSSLPVEVARSN